jgi:hypothetical protein
MHRRAFLKLGGVAAGTVVARSSTTRTAPKLRLLRQHAEPVLTKRHPEAMGNRYGFEGGRVVKAGSIYHLFTSEMVGDPIWVSMKLAHWRSHDGHDWKRVDTLFTSSGEFAGKDPRAALWSPLPVFDETEKRWNLFYVAYRAAPMSGGRFLLNHHGEIWRAVSGKAGEAGIGGPYKDTGVIMKPGPDSDPWEGLQGTDSFFPYRVGRGWRALYGSAKTEVMPIQYWGVGLAKASSLAGEWKRCSAMNPMPIEKVFVENPIVEPLRGGGYLCVYDSNAPDAIGYAFSADGERWNPGCTLSIQPRSGVWAKDVRTPLGLVHEGGNEYSVFYTGFESPPEWNTLLEGKGGATSCAVGLVRVALD